MSANELASLRPKMSQESNLPYLISQILTGPSHAFFTVSGGFEGASKLQSHRRNVTAGMLVGVRSLSSGSLDGKIRQPFPGSQRIEEQRGRRRRLQFLVPRLLFGREISCCLSRAAAEEAERRREREGMLMQLRISRSLCGGKNEGRKEGRNEGKGRQKDSQRKWNWGSSSQPTSHPSSSFLLPSSPL